MCICVSHQRCACSAGANMIIADVLPTRADRQRYRSLVDSAVAAHMNMIRVWGGGLYPPQDFYDMCDERGVLVWQEAMMACALYPRDQAFLQEVVCPPLPLPLPLPMPLLLPLPCCPCLSLSPWFCLSAPACACAPLVHFPSCEHPLLVCTETIQYKLQPAHCLQLSGSPHSIIC